MNKHTTIVIIASIFIAGPFVYSGWNIFGADQLQFKGAEDGRFSYYGMISDREIIVCNTLPFYVNFNRINIVTFFEEENKGSFSTLPITISPLSSLTINGTFSSETFEEIQYYSLHFDSMFSGSAPVRIDPTKFSVVTEIETPIIGVIPYSVTKQYSGMNFWNMMNGNSSNFNC